ncbi:MAG TPA: clostripain-related cysteine peptidase [Iamia sp.]|nr:clostripain-related cysteine peptidase [Iamia sp.]
MCVLAVLGLLAGCSGGDDDGGDDEGAPTSEPESDGGGEETTSDARSGEGWTILQFQMADTNLEEPMMADLVEMTEVGSQEGLNLVALVDRSAEETSEDLLNIPDWAGAKRLSVDEAGFTEQEDIGDLNMGDPATLSEFIATGVAENPAAHYALIVSDHGASWPGVGPDDSSGGDVLTLDEISSGIADGLEQAGLDRFDLLGFDACLMAGYEVASTLAPLADRMVASSELEPGHGWDYRALQVVADNPDATADELGHAIVDGFQSQATENQTDQDITLSLLDLTQMGPLDEAMSAFSSALSERGADIAPVVGAQRAEVLEFGKDPDPAQSSNAADLGVLVAEIGAEALDVSDQADAVMTAMNDVVAYKIAGPVSQASTGLSIYFPPESAYYNAEYDAVPAAADWATFLASYYGAGDEIATEDEAAYLSNDGSAENFFFDEDGLNLVSSFDPALEASLTEATIRYGLSQEDGSTLYLGVEPAEVSADGSGVALGIYDLTTFEISDGIDTVTAFVDLSLDEESGIGTLVVPMAYYAPGDVEGETYQDVRLVITYDPETADVLSEVYYAIDPETGTAGELQAEPEGLIAPELLQVNADGIEEWVASSDIGLFANLPDLTYDFPALPSGTEVYAELTIVDYGGNSATVTALTPVP